MQDEKIYIVTVNGSFFVTATLDKKVALTVKENLSGDAIEILEIPLTDAQKFSKKWMQVVLTEQDDNLKVKDVIPYTTVQDMRWILNAEPKCISIPPDYFVPVQAKTKEEAISLAIAKIKKHNS